MSNGKNWSIQLPALAAVQALDPSYTRLPEGPYRVKIVDSEEHKDGNSITFQCVVTEECPEKGAEVRINIGKDISKQGNLKSWSGVLRAIGATDQNLVQALQAGPSTFNGRDAFMFVKSPPAGEATQDGKNYDNRNFVTPEMYAKFKAQAATRPVATGGAPVGAPAAIPQFGMGAAPVQAPVTAPATLPGIPAPSQNGVAQLGQTFGAAPTGAPAAPVGTTFGLPG